GLLEASRALGVVALDARHCVMWSNAKAGELLVPKGAGPVACQSFTDFIGAAGIGSETFRQRLENALRTDETETLSIRRDEDSIRIHIDAPVNGTRLLYLVSTTSELPSAESQSIRHDPLTGLGNRLVYDDIVSAWSAASDASRLAVLTMDLDRFKVVNDTMGIAAGDELLRLVARRLQSVTRGDDVLIRLSGDEFVIIQCSGSQPEGAESAARRAIEILSRPFLMKGQQIHIGASVGIALLSAGEDPQDLLKHSSLGLYAAKGAGGGTFRFFEPALEHRAVAQREMEAALRSAIARRELSLVYQPQVEMETGQVRGFEALVRWERPGRGMVSPIEFIPLAEQIGEIHAIGEWVLRRACEQAMTWPASVMVGVNVSPIQFRNERFPLLVEEVLASTGLPPERLELEITEGVLMDDSDRVIEMLWALRDMGISIAMDDFGTGYSSLSYLNSFPFSKLKIDQAFVRCEQTPRIKKLVASILRLGESMEMRTLAEGVETREQYEELQANGCSQAQGYLISRPMPASDIDTFLQTHSSGARLEQ
ncbi:MAG: bifunctional diguanylate cyclase/phosphodiesterase, partial [Pseudomonadales bacterium]|nr:bifunctional diguanylate cyclase/phosphodiesterase [Pseudomonadales bacterium]